jgi:hypothetical protein
VGDIWDWRSCVATLKDLECSGVKLGIAIGCYKVIVVASPG